MDLIGKIDSLHEARRAAKFGKYTAAIIGFGVLWLSLRPPIHIIGLVTGCIFIAAAAGIHLMSRFAACFMFLFYALIFVVSLQSRGPSRMALGFSILVAFSYSVMGTFTYQRLLRKQNENQVPGFLPVTNVDALRASQPTLDANRL